VQIKVRRRSAVKVKHNLVFLNGQTDEAFKAREKDRAVGALSKSSDSTILKNIEVLTAEDHTDQEFRLMC
jgi:hypothetical protein